MVGAGNSGHCQVREPSRVRKQDCARFTKNHREQAAHTKPTLNSLLSLRFKNLYHRFDIGSVRLEGGKSVGKNTAIAVLVASMIGCATVDSALRSKDEGTVVVYDVPEAKAWEIARKVFRWEGSDAIEEDRPNKVLMTSSSMDAVSWGAVMVCWIESIDSTHTKITVVTKRRYQLGLFTTMTESTFHSQFARAVEMVKAGKPLPLTRPKSAPQNGTHGTSQVDKAST